MKKTLKQIEGILLLALTLFLILSFYSYSEYDPGFEFAKVSFPSSSSIHNLGGLVGAYFSGLFLFLLGTGSYILPVLTGFVGAHKTRGKGSLSLKYNLLGGFLLLPSASVFFSLLKIAKHGPHPSGGILGVWLSENLLKLLGREGSLVSIISLGTIGFLLSIGWTLREDFSWFQMQRHFRTHLIKRPRKSTLKIKNALSLKKEKKITPAGEKGDFVLPSFSLLKSSSKLLEERGENNLKRYAKVIEETIADFDLEVKVTEISQGPVVTMYELTLAPGITPHRIEALADNIAMALKAPNVRILAPLPGKSTVGIEVPNPKATLVYLKDILLSEEFKEKGGSKLRIALGKDILDRSLLADLKTMPHLLIAGATGSGKTVCINAIVLSLLFQNTPSELRFLMIDPKMVELTPYNNIPHLLLPPITAKENSVKALKWLVNEMESRYELFFQRGVKNIESYNKIEKNKPLFYIVVIIDELSDLMLLARDEIEKSIIRLSQLARATGIHLILATQRPSVNVITGVIKANLPSRISFQVSSKVDSRTILDMNGAEKLLGKGDLLYLSATTYQPIRAQGSLVSDEEIENVCNFLRSQGEPSYFSEILEEEEEKMFEGDGDPLFAEAIKIVFESHLASISYLQRRLRIGFNRAARLIEEMETKGILGPYREGKPREILNRQFKV